jgi:hypothetical protein
LVLLIIVYTLSSRKLKVRAKQFLPGSKGVGGEWEEAGAKGGGMKEGRNDPNILCTYE